MTSPRGPGREQAIVEYGPADFTIVEPGAFVLCAVTGQPISIVDLRYWSHVLQEAYVDASAAYARFKQLEKEGKAP